MPVASRVSRSERITAWKAELARLPGGVPAFLEHHRLALLAAFTLVYFAGAALRARGAPFWHDELYTMMLSHLDLPHMWAALRDGLETSPPLADILVRAANLLWGESNIVSRIPAMIGFWVLCVCLFAFVRRRVGVVYAFAALLLPLSTGAYLYATEARCYGMVLGFCGAAVFAWQSAAEGRRRAIALPVLALGIAAAMFSHYYAFLLLIPLGGAELWRTVRQKTIDWPMWTALFAGAALGGGLSYPFLAGTKRFQGHPWAQPRFQYLLGFYPSELTAMVTVAVCFLALLAVWWMLRRQTAGAVVETIHQVPEHELVLAILFLTMPAAGYVVAVYVTRMFTDRYFICAVVGVVLLSVFMTAIWSRANRTVGVLLLLATLPSTTFLFIHHLPVTPVLDEDRLLREALLQGPVIMDDGIHFFQEWYYLPDSLKQRLSYVSDPPSANRFVGNDTIDLGFLQLRKWYGLPILDYAAVNVPGKSFVIYHNAGGPAWLPTRLLKDGARIEVLEQAGDRSILKATVPAR